MRGSASPTRRLRAAGTIAVMWALVWLPIGLALALYAARHPPDPSNVIARPVDVPWFVAAWTLWGAVSGGVFAVLLALAERRRTLGELSLPRMALWGAVGAATLPTALTLIDVVQAPLSLRLYDWRLGLTGLTVSAVLGGACAAMTLALARRRVG